MKTRNNHIQTSSSRQSLALKLIDTLTPLNRAFCSQDYEKAVAHLCQILPFEVVRFSSGQEHNGWVVPPRLEVKEASILKNGKLIYDGLAHPVRVITLTKPFCGKVTRSELQRHLHYDNRNESAVPFHFRQQYRPWQRDWGFCVTKDFFDSLDEGEYDVIIRTEESQGELLVLAYRHKGRCDETFAFVSHLDHPGMANDGLSGCALGVELFKWLEREKTRYSYQLLLVPEIIGSDLYLGQSPQKAQILEGLFLDGLGSRTPLALQASMEGVSTLECTLEEALTTCGAPFSMGPFKSICSNDEVIWESYGIPMASLSRFPYPEYHTDQDNLSIISEDALSESLTILKKSVELIDSSELVIKLFSGTVCLSNPKYNLYVDTGQPAFGGVESDDAKPQLRRLMDFIPTMKRPMTIRSICRRLKADEHLATTYLEKWAFKGLIKLK
jgi:aminopeptidase-like protein